MSWVKANGVRFHVQQLGEGERVVVFLHGLIMDNLSSWYYTLANPIARSSRVLLYDLRGHGLSEQPASGYTLDDTVADLAALLDTLGIEHPVYLAGNSFGGTVALAFARAFPARVAGLVMVEAHFPIDGWGEELAGTLELASIWMEAPRVMEWRDENEKRHLRRRFRAYEKFMSSTTLLEDIRAIPTYGEKELGEVTCPTLALYGDASDVIDRGRDLERWMPGCELRVLPDSAHSILMERTQLVRDHVTEWLDKQPPLGRRG